MNVQKKVIGSLEKCYSLATFEYDSEKHFAVAAEKKDEIDIFTCDGQKKDVLHGGRFCLLHRNFIRQIIQQKLK